jgi:hypothetical protein
MMMMIWTMLALILSSSSMALNSSDLKTLYPEQSESFISERIKQCNDAFCRWTSFPRAYYAFVKNIPQVTPARTGMCAGDPHFENFGFYPTSKESLFTINDFDDSSDCSLDDDLLRLYFGGQLLTDVSVKDFLENYRLGLSGKNKQIPAVINKRLVKSKSKFHDFPKKYKKLLKKGKCSGDFADLSITEKLMLEGFLKSGKKSAQLLCTRNKSKGGSAGLKRYVIISKEGSFELKPLDVPAPLFGKSIKTEDRKLIYDEATKLFLNDELRKDFYSVTFDDRPYQRRPLWAGVEAMKIDEFDKGAKREVLLHEAYTLGTLHKKSNPSPMTLTDGKFEERVTALRKLWEPKFK